ncbi:MAG TPA: TetR/AcrR family transcriptional regulator [Tenuifilaceae bacterium]|nr:TetR/AcrR family transcriptional regulator [Tenuifilaceae bacterium]HPI44449.1 TetR/AcrR family transcriptional regulator [Tenuifilaceae bacterium]HPN20379.1 TetR/AcrR family transcriptional regulator [Tenuifilaceae bacterium]
MKNKIIQEKRMRGYFIQAAKEILKGEGLDSISVRNIADQAGYSYATLYNYFKDVKDLIFECIKDFQEECEEFVIKETKNSPRGTEKIKDITKAYVKYFVEYPGVFELFFLEKISDIENKQPTSELICSFLDRLCEEEWKYCTKEEIVGIGSADKMRTILKYQIPGLLLLYLNRHYPPDYKEFLSLVDRQLEKIIKAETSAKTPSLFEPDILNFIFEDDSNRLIFIHYTKDEYTARKIIQEGFRYTETFYNTAEQVVNDKLDLMYKHNMYKYYGNYVVVIVITRELFTYYANEVKSRGINIYIENIFSETPPSLNENEDKVFTLPNQFIKGYVNYENGSIVFNSNFNPSYNSPIFERNLE